MKKILLMFSLLALAPLILLSVAGYKTIVSVGSLRHLQESLKSKDLPQLSSLDLRKTKITDLGVTHFQLLPSLTDLSIDETAITDSGLIELGKLPTLQSLSIRRTKITDAAVKAFQAAHPTIRVDR